MLRLASRVRSLPSAHHMQRRAARSLSTSSSSELTGVWRHAFSGFVGFSGGACVGLVGWGGAQFIIPGMSGSLMNLPQLAATGVSLCSLSLGTCMSSVKFAMTDNVSISTAVAIALPSVAAARIGSRLAARMSDDALSLAFNAASVVLIPIHFLVQRHAQQTQEQRLERRLSEQPSHHPPVPAPPDAHSPSSLSLSGLAQTLDPKHFCFGCVSGVISAIMGVGGLPFTMSYLTAFTPLPHHMLQGTAALAVAPSVLTSALSRIHVVPPATAAAVTAGAVCGSFVGASVALRLSEERLRELYMLSLVLLGGRSFVAGAYNLRNIWARRVAAGK
jgi:uncharacterized membrane protein YfcA